MLYVENTNEKINSLSASFLNFVLCGRLLETCTLIELTEQLTQKSGKDGLKFLRQALYTGLKPEQITHQNNKE